MTFSRQVAFRGELAFCSNFYPSPGVTWDMHEYATSEAAFQAAKTLDEFEREAIRNAKTPGEAKKLGQQVTMRPNWDKIKVQVMKQILESKFADETLADKLVATGDMELVETNYWNDTFWGVCNGVGENNLGKLLMNLRTRLKG